MEERPEGPPEYREIIQTMDRGYLVDQDNHKDRHAQGFKACSYFQQF
jgi:hypothetical protein